MAGMAGFEPADDGTKNRCLTTWRHPNNASDYIYLLQFLQAIFKHNPSVF